MELNKNSNLIIRLVNISNGIKDLKTMQDEVNTVIKDTGLCIYKIKINAFGNWALYTVVLAEKSTTTVNVASGSPLDAIDLNSINMPE